MNNTEEADNFFDQFIRDNLPTTIAVTISDEDIEKLIVEINSNAHLHRF